MHHDGKQGLVSICFRRSKRPDRLRPLWAMDLNKEDRQRWTMFTWYVMFTISSRKKRFSIIMDAFSIHPVLRFPATMFSRGISHILHKSWPSFEITDNIAQVGVGRTLSGNCQIQKTWYHCLLNEWNHVLARWKLRRLKKIADIQPLPEDQY